MRLRCNSLPIGSNVSWIVIIVIIISPLLHIVVCCCVSNFSLSGSLRNWPSIVLFPGHEDIFPELPTVPNNTLPDIGNSVGDGTAGGDDVDFDDLTRRFEQLKKKK